MKLTPKEKEIVKVLAKAKEISFEEALKDKGILNAVSFRRKNKEKDLKKKLLALLPKKEFLEANPKPTPFEEEERAKRKMVKDFEKHREEREAEQFKQEKKKPRKSFQYL